MHRDLFNYAKGYDADWVDPNANRCKRNYKAE